MKKILSLVLALVMLMAVVPVYSEDASSGESVLSMLGSLMNGEGEEGNGLGSLLGSLLGGGDGEGFSLSSLLKPLVEKLRSVKGVKLPVIINALKEKLSGLFGGSTRSAEGGSGLSDLLGSLFSGDGSESGEGGDSGLSDLLGGLFGGEDADLSGFLSGGDESSEDVDGAGLLSLLGGLLGGEEGGEEGGELLSLLGGLLGGDGSAEGGDDGELLSLLGALFGDEEGSEEFDIEALLADYYASDEYQAYLRRMDAAAVHLNEEFDGAMELGDVQVLADSPLLNFENEDPNFELGYYSLFNFKAEGKDLKLVSYVGSWELLTFEEQEDGTFKVINAVVAREGDEMEADMQAMCDAFGVPFEDYTEHLDYIERDEVDCLAKFMKDHPEYERLEYQGELRTAEELSALEDAILDMQLAAYNEEGSAE